MLKPFSPLKKNTKAGRHWWEIHAKKTGSNIAYRPKVAVGPRTDNNPTS